MQRNASKTLIGHTQSRSSLHGPADVSIITKFSTISNIKTSKNNRPIKPKLFDKDLDKKADFRDLQYLMDLKSNKVDTEQIMRCVDI